MHQRACQNTAHLLRLGGRAGRRWGSHAGRRRQRRQQVLAQRIQPQPARQPHGAHKAREHRRGGVRVGRRIQGRPQRAHDSIAAHLK